MSNTHTQQQTIGTARRLAKAEDYVLMAEAIAALNINAETKSIEVNRYNDLAEEFYTDADDLRGQVDPELIDYL